MNDMAKINDVIALLLVIQNYSKDIHYNCKGEAFYSKHLLCDRISEEINNYIDNIKEVFFLAIGEVPLSSKEYLKLAIDKIPNISNDDKDNFVELAQIISKTLQIIQDLNNLSIGEENLIGNIAENLQTSLGLLIRQVL